MKKTLRTFPYQITLFYFDGKKKVRDEAISLLRDVIGHKSQNDEEIEIAKNLLNLLGGPLTIAREADYNDRIYRDTYYTLYSKKFSAVERNCLRLSFFRGYLSYEDLCSKTDDELTNLFIGTMVIKPTYISETNTFIGRTYLDPCKLNLTSNCYLRRTQFSVTIFNHRLTIDAFPFSSQDGELMTCAETAFYNLMEYYGTRYPNYTTILPSQIIELLRSFTDERQIPSNGLSYNQLSRLFKSSGFEPRVYDKVSYEKSFRNIFSYYVESAIPFVVALTGGSENGFSCSANVECPARVASQHNHAAICIGHGDLVFPDQQEMQKEISIRPLNNGGHGSLDRLNELYLIDSSKFIQDFVIVDDNDLPYRLDKFDKFGCYQTIDSSDEIKLNHYQAEMIVVPLHRHVFLDCINAKGIIDKFLGTIIARERIFDLLDELKTNNSEANPLVLRLFLTTSRNYRVFRGKGDLQCQYFYSNLQFPKFVWVCEISTFDLYKKEKIVADIAIDATASPNTGEENMLVVRFGKDVFLKPSKEDLFLCLESGESYILSDESAPYPLYSLNLRSLRKEELR